MRHLIVSFTLCILLLVPCCAAAAAQDDERALLDITRMPVEAATVKDFIPPGWSRVEELGGDLDADGRADVVLRLIEQQQPESEGGFSGANRAFVVLLRTGAGKLRRVGTNDRAQLCDGCAGTLGAVGMDSNQMQIARGVIILNHLSGARDSYDVTFRFRYDAPSGRVRLIGADTILTDRLAGDGTTESINYLTGVKLTTKTRFDKRLDREVKASTKRERVPARKIFLEAVDFEKMYGAS